ncbi:MAG TPA: ABC transporter ATP-binding protein, partial [Microlunatus sp.]|nr:ABC transporter ATP-binding protein [Microlunatus sp.]
DEPTNHLDPRAQLDLLHLVAQLDCTRIVVIHDLDHALAIADRIVLLHQGRLVAHGRPRAVLDAANLSAVFGLESRIVPHPIDDRDHLTFARPAAAPATT